MLRFIQTALIVFRPMIELDLISPLRFPHALDPMFASTVVDGC